jgi:hypothetical protein
MPATEFGVNSATDAIGFPGVPENAILGAGALKAAPLKEQRRQDCACRQWRSYRGPTFQRQRFPGTPGPGRSGGGGCKLLERLNFSGPAAIAGVGPIITPTIR